MSEENQNYLISELIPTTLDEEEIMLRKALEFSFKETTVILSNENNKSKKFLSLKLDAVDDLGDQNLYQHHGKKNIKNVSIKSNNSKFRNLSLKSNVISKQNQHDFPKNNVQFSNDDKLLENNHAKSLLQLLLLAL